MVTTEFVHPPAHKTLRDWVFDCLRSSIVSGDLAPGQRIVEADLAKQLDVSKSPVREAILQLKQDGLVVDAPKGRGVVVAPLHATDVGEIYAVRHALEALAARSAAGAPEAGDALRNSVARMRAAVERGDAAAQFQEDLQFHSVLCAASGNRRLNEIFQGLRPDIQRIGFALDETRKKIQLDHK